MSDVNEILKKVTASIEEATGKFNAKAEEALTEAKKRRAAAKNTSSLNEILDVIGFALHLVADAPNRPDVPALGAEGLQLGPQALDM